LTRLGAEIVAGLGVAVVAGLGVAVVAGLGVAVVAGLGATALAGADDGPLGGPAPASEVDPGAKFIPSFAVKYSDARTGLRSAEETARFDLLIVGPGHWQAWAENGRNSWQTLRTFNPDLVIALYAAGPGAYDTSSWGELGEGWTWMQAQHGIGSDDRWTAVGAWHGTYLQHSVYGDSRAMFLGNPRWQQYWIDAYYADRWAGGRGQDQTGADAVFADGTGYEVTGADQWRVEGDPSQVDHPSDYYDGAYDHTRWRADTNAFFERAVSQLAAKPERIKLIPNFGRLDSHPEYWRELEDQPYRPFAAMQEGGLVKSYGTYTYNYHQWAQKVAAMRDRTIPVVMACHGKAGDLAAASGLARMDLPATDGVTGTTGWDALWFAMVGFLLALNEDRSNGYFGFSIWTYSEYYWFDELDPHYVDLGPPLGDYYVTGGVYFREYEDGWVVANPPYGQGALSVAVPRGSARPIGHAELYDPEAAPLVTRFDLGSARGAILLKPGRRLGNQDNVGARLWLPFAGG
jgi:hypothetical protein